MEVLELTEVALKGLDGTRKKAIRDKVASGKITLNIIDTPVEAPSIDYADLGTRTKQIGSDGIDHSLPVGFGSDELDEKHKKEKKEAFEAQSLPKKVLDATVETAKEVGQGMIDRVDDAVNIVSPVEIPISQSPNTLRATIDRNMDEYLEGSVPFKVYEKLGKLSQTQNRWNEIIAEGNATDEDVNTYKDNRNHLLVDVMGYKSVGTDKHGKTWVESRDGTFQKLDKDGAKAIVGELFGDKAEIVLAGLGALKGYKKAKAFGKKGQFVASLLGGATGATVGNVVDQLAGYIETGEKLSLSQRVDEVGKSVLADTTGTVVGGLVLKGVVAGAKGAYAVPKAIGEKLYKHIANGNLDGAKKIMKSDLMVDDAHMDDALKQMQGWQEEVVNGEVNLVENAKNIMGADNKKEAFNQLVGDATDNLGNAQAKEELLATAMSHPQGLPALEGALNANPEGALRLQSSIDARVKQAFDMTDAASGTEIKNAVKGYEGRVKTQYNDMRDTFTEAFKESDYRFDLDDLKIEESIEEMGSRIGDDYARKQFEAMSAAVNSQINGTRNGAGVTRNIDDLLDLWQKMNRFYGKHAGKLDKPDAEVFVKIKKDIGAEVDRALKENTSPEIAKQLRGYFDDARDAYTKMYEVKGTKLYDGLMAEGKNATQRVDALLKHAKDDEGELQTLLSKLSPEEAGKAEDAILESVLQKYTKGKHDELRALDMSKALDDLEELKPFLKSEASENSIKLLSDMHSKFRHDFALSGTIKGVRNGQTSSGIATTWQGKLEAHTAGKIFNYVSTLIPIGANPKRLALQRHLASALRKSRTPLDMAKHMSRVKSLPLDKRTELKELIKIHNRALAAENKTKAEAVTVELREFEAKVEKQRLDKALEVEEFVKPDITELRAVSHLNGDNRQGSFSQIVRRIQDGKASEVDVQKYLDAKRNVAKGLDEQIEAEMIQGLPAKYRELGDEDIQELERLRDFVGDDAFDARKVKRLMHDLRTKGVPRNLEYDALYDDMKALSKEKKSEMDALSGNAVDEPLDANGNAVFMKGIDHLLAGGVAGVEVDESGSITLDTEKFILGMGGYAAAKALLKNPRVKQEVKDLVMFGVEKLEKKAEGGDVYAQALLGRNYLYVGAKAGDAGAFSNVYDKGVRKWVDDDTVKFTLPEKSKKDVSKYFDIEQKSDGEIADYMALENFKGSKDDYIAEQVKKGYDEAYDITKDKYSLGEVLDHKELFKEYPELKNIDVSFYNRGKFSMKGQGEFSTEGIGLEIQSPSEMRSVLLHEIQHYIQSKEGWGRGGNIDGGRLREAIREQVRHKYAGDMKEVIKSGADPIEKGMLWDAFINNKIKEEFKDITPFQAYERLAGEQEARAVQAKLKHPELDPYAALAKEEGVLPEPLVKFDDGVNYSKELSKKYFFKDGRINQSALRRESVPFRKLDYTIENFKSEFPEGSVKTPHGEVKIHEHQFTKLGHKNRESLFGLIKPTLEEPSFTVEFEDVTVFFKPFRDNKGIVKFASISKDKDDYLVITSNYALTGGKFEKIFRTGKLLVPEASGKKALNHSSGNKSIPQKPTDVKKEAK